MESLGVDLSDVSDRFHRVQVYCRIAPLLSSPALSSPLLSPPPLSSPPLPSPDLSDTRDDIPNNNSYASTTPATLTAQQPGRVLMRRVTGGRPEERCYDFDGVFESSVPQAAVYGSSCSLLCDDILQGYNASVMAYGQTGSGKTYTITGPRIVDEMGEAAIDTTCIKPEDGLLPRIFDELITKTNEHKAKYGEGSVSVQVAYVQLYCEELQDLLPVGDSELRAPLMVREHPSRGVYIQNLAFHNVDSLKRALDYTVAASRNRIVASTMMNAHSSRSHAIVMLRVTTKRPSAPADASVASPKPQSGLSTSAVLTVVDLAGSERAGKSFTGSGSTMSDIRSAEMRAINLSLTALGNVIAALTTATTANKRKGNTTHIPYRNSVLTRILQNSLGGDARASLIVTVSASPSCVGESQASMDFGCRARKVRVRATIQRDSDDIEYWKGLCKELQKAEKERTQAGEPQDIEYWKTRCVELQREIMELRAEAPRDDLSEAGLEGGSNRIQELRAENRTLKDTIDQYGQQLREKDDAVAELRDKNDQLSRMVEALEEATAIVRSYGQTPSTSGDSTQPSSTGAGAHPLLVQLEAVWKEKLAKSEARHSSELASMRQQLAAKVADANTRVRDAEEDRDAARDELLQLLQSYRQTRIALRDSQKDVIGRMSEAVEAIEAGRMREEELAEENARLHTMCQVLEAMQDQSAAATAATKMTTTTDDVVHAAYMARISALSERVQQLENSRSSRVFSHDGAMMRPPSAVATVERRYMPHRQAMLAASQLSTADATRLDGSSSMPNLFPGMPVGGSAVSSSGSDKSSKSVGKRPASMELDVTWLDASRPSMPPLFPSSRAHQNAGPTVSDSRGIQTLNRKVPMSPLRPRPEEALLPSSASGPRKSTSSASSASTSAQLMRYNLQRLSNISE